MVETKLISVKNLTAKNLKKTLFLRALCELSG